MRKLIKVTKEHIKNGIKGNCKHCPVALAITESIADEVNKFTSVSVGPSDISIWRFINGSTVYKAPVRVARFIKKFDTQKKVLVKPFNFYLQEE